MKLLGSLIAALTLMRTAPALAQAVTQPALVGTWVLDLGSQKYTYTLRPDSTMLTEASDASTKKKEQHEDRWRVVGDTISFKQGTESDTGVSRYKFRLQGKQLQLFGTDDEKMQNPAWTWERVSPTTP